MQAVLDKQDYQHIADEVLKLIKTDYELVPKRHNQIEQWVGIQEFAEALPVRKDKEWVRMFILQRPEFEKLVFNLNAGKGHRVKVNMSKGLAWVNEHRDEVDWNQPLPR
jgi:hypothetical protein